MKLLTTIKNNIPNSITCLNLISGVLAIIVSFTPSDVCGCIQGHQFQIASCLIILGAVFDFFDGMVARLIHATSAIGKELDSLSDLVTFGIAPALVMFNALQTPWCKFSMLLIAAFAAVRLAKFNIDTRQTTSFIGLPVPANALFWIGYCSFIIENPDIAPEWLSAVFAIVFSFLMVSEIPMFSLKFKSLALQKNLVRYALMLCAVVFVCFFNFIGCAFTILLYIILSLIFGNGEKK